MIHEYIAEGILEKDTRTYVKRKTDEELYEQLKAGKFCYVLNARKMGKSSLQVQIKSRLEKEGFACSVIDLEGKDTHETTWEKWYYGILNDLKKDLKLEIDLSNWWKKSSLSSTLDRFRHFIESVILTQISKPIVIFIDEIDTIRSLKLPNSDDFFAFIRGCYNLRAKNSDYKRLTFCLLGVASPSDLINNKNRTPFNIGTRIDLEGFKWDEIGPLLDGLESVFGKCKAEAVMRRILYWTGGQPFLTQKLCMFMVEESKKDYPRSVDEVVKARVITNWQSQDNPEFLQTIQNRILANERQASDLLERYQEILQLEEIDSNNGNSSISDQLCLSGLVIKARGKLRVSNRICKAIFDKNWIEIQFAKLCPYMEDFEGWVASEKKDQSRLLRGMKLEEAQEWFKGKNLINDRRLHCEFFNVSRYEEQKIAILELQTLQKVEQSNQVLTQANEKAKKRIRDGSIVLIVAVILLGWVLYDRHLLQEKISIISELSVKITQLQDRGNEKEVAEAKRQLGLSQIKEIRGNYAFQQALLLSEIALADYNLGQWEKAIKAAEESIKILRDRDSKNSLIAKEILLHALNIQGVIYKNKDKQVAKEIYTEAFELLESNSSQFKFLNSENKIIHFNTIQAVHRELIKLLETESTQNNDLLSKVKTSQLEYFYAELEKLLKNKNWKEADNLTAKIAWDLAGTFQKPSLIKVAQNLSCEDFRSIDALWRKYSNNRFGFSVQSSIWRSKRVNGDLSKFMSLVEWGNKKQEDGKVTIYVYFVNDFSLEAPIGQFPWFITFDGAKGIGDRTAYLNKIANCYPLVK